MNLDSFKVTAPSALLHFTDYLSIRGPSRPDTFRSAAYIAFKFTAQVWLHLQLPAKVAYGHALLCGMCTAACVQWIQLLIQPYDVAMR